MRIPEEKVAKMMDIDRRYRSTWDVRTIAHVVGVSPGTAAKVLRQARGPRPKPVKRPHNRRTRFLSRDVMWSSDFMELPGKKELIKTLDEASRFRLGWDISQTATAESALKHAQSIVDRMGRAPLVWKYDHGSAFTSDLFQEFLARHGIVPYPIPPRSPWVQGRVERDNREIQNWLIPVENKILSPEELEKEVDEGMWMLNFLKPRAVLDFKTSVQAYFNGSGVEAIDREQLHDDLEKIQRQLPGCNGERLHRKATRQLLQNWSLYEEWLHPKMKDQIVNTSHTSCVAF